jgi:hypothetical protein
VFSRKVFFSSAGDTDDISTAALDVFLELSVCVGLGVCITCEFHSQALHANPDKTRVKCCIKMQSILVRIYLYTQHFYAYVCIKFICMQSV